MTTKAEIDPLIGRTSLAGLTAAYLYGADLRAPLASPLHTDLHGLPPLLMQVGAAETLLDNPVRSAALPTCRCGSKSGRTMICVWYLFYQLFYQRLEPGRQALAAAGALIRSRQSPGGA
jgi:epsilon-lactone hydrolase